VIGAIYRSTLRYLLRHRWQAALAIVGIALGVAVVVAIDLANQSASRGFQLSMEQVAGRTTHQLLGGPSGIDEAIYPWLRITQGLRGSAPVVEGRVAIRGEPFTLLGVDPLAEGGFRDFASGIAPTDLRRLLSEPGTLLMSRADAQRLGIPAGTEAAVAVEVDGRQTRAQVIGFFGDAEDALLDGLLVADIATAQELLDRSGRLDRIDLILTDEQAATLARVLPGQLRLERPENRTATLLRMSEAFRINLSAMSLLALLVGTLLIYNTMTFAVLQRRALLATLRALGVTRGEIASAILFEALLLGTLGSLLGLALGSAIAQALLHLVTRTINDLYYVVNVTELILDPLLLLKGLGIGMGASLLAALVPALEAARSRPQAAQRRSVLEGRSHRLTPWLTASGVLLCGLGWALTAQPSGDLIAGFGGLFLIIVGYSLVVPAAVVLFARALTPLLGRLFGVTGTFAGRAISRGLSRTGLAVAALSVAVSATIGVGIMVESFRFSVAEWLTQTLQSDVYLSAPHALSSRAAGTLDPAIPQRLRGVSGISELSTGRRREIETAHGPVELAAIGMAAASYRGFRFLGDTLDAIWPRFRSGKAVLVSEPYARRQGLLVGQTLELFTAAGPRDFTVGGIFQDYGAGKGLVVMHRPVYAALWQDPSISSIGVYVAPGHAPQSVIADIRAALTGIPRQPQIRTNLAIREHSLAIFDRTFTVTRVLRLLAIGVAFIGVFSALMALLLEQAREHAILRASGATVANLLSIVSLQAGLLGFLAAILAMPLGWWMSAVLIDVINLRSFGWTMQTVLPPGVFGGAALLALAAALLAGTYPAWRIARMPPAATLREE